MRTITPATPNPQAPNGPRLRRSAAAVIAQYIQDLTSPSEPAGCTA
jgi:hypothetical protein